MNNCLQSYKELCVCGNLMLNTHSIGNTYFTNIYMCKFEISYWKFRFMMYNTGFEVIILFCFIAHTIQKSR